MSRFSAIDLSQLPAPALIEALDYEAVLAALMADVQARFDAAGIAYDVGGLETDPARIILEVAAYRELLLRALVNDKARAVLLAYATGSDLDHLGALYATARKVLTPASDNAPAVMEGDTDFRARIQIAPEAFSVAGPAGAYVYHALAAAPSIARAHAFSPADGSVTVVLAGAAGAAASDAALAAVVERLERADVRPLTDQVAVVRATTVTVNVAATLHVARGPDPALIVALATAAATAYLAGRYQIGAEVYRSGLIAALQVGGVERVDLAAPAADIAVGETEIAVKGAIVITAEVA